MGIRLINIFGTMYNPLDIRSVSCPEKIETNADNFTELVRFKQPEPGNWILPKSLFASFHVTFASHKAGNTSLEIKVEEPVPEVLKVALAKARETKLKRDWFRQVDEQQVDDLRRMVQASMGVMEVMAIYSHLRHEAAKACTNTRVDWMFAMEEIPVYKYPPETTFKMLPMDAGAA